ncbi:putative polyketide synthase [Thozetella sp. PMI_491]|nr:putative polyketide synthase [Thozetella sp. PMI_491]
MAGLHPQGRTSARLLVFGPQALSLNPAALERLWDTIHQMGKTEWVLKIVSELPNCWNSFASAFPRYRVFEGAATLAKLREWLVGGKIADDDAPILNIFLSPLVVISHLLDYIRYRKSTTNIPDAPPGNEVLGFCIGILSAITIEKYGSSAVLLAMLIGGVVDTQGMLDSQGPSKSLSTAWTSRDASDELHAILRRFPGAYTSVSYDDCRATVTVPSKSLPALQQDLRRAGIIANEIGLHGRFHHDWYNEDIKRLVDFCGTEPALRLPEASALLYPTTCDSESGIISSGTLHEHALRTILINHSNWYATFKSIHQISQPCNVISFGPESCVPPSILRQLESSQTYTNFSALVTPEARKADDIAIVGTSIKVAGADDLVEFWDILCAAKSQHGLVPTERIPFTANAWRNLGKDDRVWYGNFLRDADAFDHRFFRKSAREAAASDPQQRLLLQAAYQALEQSGYFSAPEDARQKHVGCYVGVCAADYWDNVASHAPSAFTATGNLQGFLAGRVSHYFGWTAPSLCVDTACSSSLVAIHLACRAILSGECEAALAGGVNVITNSLWFQNLAAASFLSPSGQCKPFDADADGYCRGEAIAVVYLKRMSAALADGDVILGTISATAVQQNLNCTPIFVPNSPSLSGLFQQVLSKSGLEAHRVGVVEAHGTGTQVGDPAEYESIRNALAGPLRDRPLVFGSVKGLVGHTEATSGVVSLIKSLLMIQHKTFLPQPSFKAMNPHLNASSADKMEILTEARAWDDSFRAVLINNYGASGSNASMMVTQAPTVSARKATSPAAEYPFRLYGKDDASLQRYLARLLQWLSSRAFDSAGLPVASLSFHLSRQCNPSLERCLTFTCHSVEQFVQKAIPSALSTPNPRPVILCFGGQVSRFVGLSRTVYGTATVLRSHLDQCNAVIRSFGCDSIFPGIFEHDPIQDPYACAKSWIDCGVRPVAVVGHSFGELTALCISGCLSLHDALRVVIGRAGAIRRSWGSDSGAMVAAEADQDLVDKLLVEAAEMCHQRGTAPPAIACFNGPRSFTIAGPSASIETLLKAIEKNSAYSGVRTKKLSVSNAFHSSLVDPLMDELDKIGKGVKFAQPTIRLERSTEFPCNAVPESGYVADHMRNPVYFNHAVQRLAKDYPSSIWLEAGSNSTITNMASRALQAPKSSYFQPINISAESGFQLQVNATLALWKEGLPVTFWPHHRCQTYDYASLLLPPYQFEKSRHWTEIRPPVAPEQPEGLWTFAGYTDQSKTTAHFNINTSAAEYVELVSGHVIARTAPICPATVEMSIVLDALISLFPEFSKGRAQPMLCNVENQVALCLDPSRKVWLEAKSNDELRCSWEWSIASAPAIAGNNVKTTKHVTGRAVFVSNEDVDKKSEFARYERLVGYARCTKLLDGSSGDVGIDIMQGRGIYAAFSDVVDYPAQYRGLQKLVGRSLPPLGAGESAGRVVKKHDDKTQVGGIWVNCMRESAAGDMYIATGFERWARAPELDDRYQRPETWDLFLSDIFAFDPANGKLVEVILGVNYHKVSKLSMRKMLTRLTASDVMIADQPKVLSAELREESLPISDDVVSALQKGDLPNLSSGGPDIWGDVKSLLAEMSGLEPETLQPDSLLADIGIDSLMGMELARELETLFKCSLPSEELMNVVDVISLVRLVQTTLGLPHSSEGEGDDGDDNSSSASIIPMSESGTGATSTSGLSDMGGDDATDGKDTELPPSIIMEAFGESKALTDRFISDYHCSGYMDSALPRQTQLCIALAVEAFEKLGCCLRTSKPGQVLSRIQHIPSHQRLVDYLYQMLSDEARLLDIVDDTITRTQIAAPSKTSDALLAELRRNYPDHDWANRLTHFAGSRLADVLSGNCDGTKLIFGTEEGRELVAGLYGDSLLNKLANVQMQDIITRLVAKIPRDQGPLRVLELGAGTGGTTRDMAALLSRLGVPVEYTFTDLSGSFVAAARKRFGKEYPFMKFRVHDIEKPPAADLVGTQHVIIASNAIHATHNLIESARNIRKALRPDGFLMMLEMTEPLYWVDMIFGLFEGWWLFDDGRCHAIAHQSVWERDLQSAGYGHVDWTDGYSPEVHIQRVFIAFASQSTKDMYKRTTLPTPPINHPTAPQVSPERRARVEEYVRKYSSGFDLSSPADEWDSFDKHTALTPVPNVILVTGATGSLGCYLVAHLSTLPHVHEILCLNRRSPTTEASVRQQRSMADKGISIDAAYNAKLTVLQSDTSKPRLGLSASQYRNLVSHVTHIVHNAWPMSGKRPLSAMEPQFQVMRNLLDLARDISSYRWGHGYMSFKPTFQFISSIAVVGYYPLQQGNSSLVPEKRMALESVLPSGYGDAKFVCERLIDETLHRVPDRFHAMCVRPGQIAGSKRTGYWNQVEHLPFLLKSAQTLGLMPSFHGDLCWTPVEDVAAAVAELLLDATVPEPVYHIDNPVRQKWEEALPILMSELGIPTGNVVAFEEWVRRVRTFPGLESENPAAKLIDFLDDNFLRMSCGGLLLDTERSCAHSTTLARVRPVDEQVMRGYLRGWRDTGFLR